MRTYIAIFFLVTFSHVISLGAKGQVDACFVPDSILKIMHAVNDYQRSHPWTAKDDYNWIRGTYYTGVMAAWQATGKRKFFEQCVHWGEAHQWGIPPIKLGSGASGANVLTCAQTWLECYFERRAKERITPVINHLALANTKNPTNQPLDWYWEGGRRYVDALFVGPPALLMLYKATKEEQYLQWMESFVWDVYGKLYDHEDSLFYRDQRFRKGYFGEINTRDIRPDSIERADARRSYVYTVTPSGKKVFWSRGNGWAFAGIARILKYLPADHGSYDRYLSLFRQMAWSLRHRQGADGLWRMNLDDPEDYVYGETSGTAFFTYGLTMGINRGWLPSDVFSPIVEKAWCGLYHAVSEEGRVMWGQPVGAGPYRIFEEDGHEYVSGMFLLAASEIYLMNKK
jgi:rhamnogalacturonyl hydrolase YesR